MRLDLIVLAISAVACVGNLGMIVYYIVLTWQVRRLNLLLGQLCIRAFVGQHLPYWRPWAQVFGYDLALRVRPASEPDDQTHEGQDRR